MLGLLQGKNSLYCANAYKEMGKIKHIRKEYATAIKDYDTSLEIYIKIFGSSHQFCLIILLNLVELTFITQDIPKVTAYTERLTKLLDVNVTIASIIASINADETHLAFSRHCCSIQRTRKRL